MDLTIRHHLLNCSRWCTTIIVFIYQCTPENCEPWELKDQNSRKSFPRSYSKNPRHHEITMKKKEPWKKQKSKQTISIIFKALPNGQNKSETPKKILNCFTPLLCCWSCDIVTWGFRSVFSWCVFLWLVYMEKIHLQGWNIAPFPWRWNPA